MTNERTPADAPAPKADSRFARPVSSILIRKRGTTEFRPALEVIAEQKALLTGETAKG